MTKTRLAYLVAALALVGGIMWYVTRHGSPVPIPGGPDCGPSLGTCQSGYRCIQKCGPPVARDDDPPPGYYCERNDIADKPRQCPICLASTTMISTPGGDVNVRELRVGMVVWSQDDAGNRVPATIIHTSRTGTPKSHRVIHLVMDDGREAWISPGHPVADGATVRSAELVPYWDDATYDLLPDSATGHYWADGILMGSTLSR